MSSPSTLLSPTSSLRSPTSAPVTGRGAAPPSPSPAPGEQPSPSPSPAPGEQLTPGRPIRQLPVPTMIAVWAAAALPMAAGSWLIAPRLADRLEPLGLVKALVGRA